nr:uncharacterized protein LOC117990212 [Maniola hyperantus]
MHTAYAPPFPLMSLKCQESLTVTRMQDVCVASVATYAPCPYIAAVLLRPCAPHTLHHRCLEISFFPVLWKQATVIVLRKPGKSDYSQVKSYRPIGLLPVLGKVLEKMIVRRIRWHLLPKANPRQYGFVPQRGTEDSLCDLVQHIRNNLDNKLINVVVSLDIEGAFDSAWWPAVRCRLLDEKCPLNLRQIVNSYSNDREVRVRYADNECTVSTTKGCIQGSIAGPTFWNILLDPLLDTIEKAKVHCQAFADDIVLVFSGGSAAVIEEEVNRVLSLVYEWGVAHKLKFAPHKTSAMVITKKLKYDTPRIHMGGTLVQLVEEIKILGLILDSKLTFNNHIKYICKKALNIYKPLARSAKINWGLSAEVIRTMYVAVIEPIILYASNVWAPAANKITVQKYLNTVQRGFAQKMCKAYRTVSLNAAIVLTGTIPLDLRALETKELYEAKRGKPQSIIGDREVETKVCFLEAVHPAREAIEDFVCLEDLSAETIGENSINGLSIFTDGSKIDGKVGAALSCWEDGNEIRSSKFLLERYCSVFQAELYALYKATEYVLKSNKPSVNILSDSRSALECIKNPGTFHPLAFKIRNNLTLLREKGNTIRLFWIRAHVGVEGNERADALAKEAARKKKTAPNYDQCPLSFIKQSIRQTTIETWNKRYQNGETAALTRLFFPDVYGAFKVVRKTKLTPIHVQVLTGHGGFGQYLKRFKCKDDSACDCDPANEESVLHLLLDCPIYGKERFELEQKTEVQIRKETLEVLLRDKKCQKAFLEYCTKIAKCTIKKNKTK